MEKSKLNLNSIVNFVYYAIVLTKVIVIITAVAIIWDIMNYINPTDIGLVPTAGPNMIETVPLHATFSLKN